MSGSGQRAGRVALAAACCALAACSSAPSLGFGVALEISTDSSVQDFVLAQIDKLRFVVSGDETEDIVVTLGRAMTRSEHLVYRPNPGSRIITLSVRAESADGSVLASGVTGSVVLTAGHTSLETVTLSDSGVIGTDLAGADLRPSDDMPDLGSGGDGSLSPCDGSCVLATGPPSWIPIAPSQHYRLSVGITSGADGRVYVLGGEPGAGPLATAEAYAPSSNTWVQLANMPIARELLVAATGTDGRIYAIGGRNTGGAALASVDVFDPSVGTWSTSTAMPSPRTYPCGALLGEKFYVAGGYDGTDYVASVDAFRFSTGIWSSQPAMPEPRIYCGAAAGADGRLYVMGGNVPNGDALGSVIAFDPTLGSWLPVTTLRKASVDVAVVGAPDGRVYAIGGRLNDVSRAEVDALTPATQSWTTVAPLPEACFVAAALAGNGRIIAICENRDAYAYGPSVQLLASSGQAGTVVVADGSNFAANADVDFFFDTATGAPLASGTSDNAGALSNPVSLTIPAVAPGKHVITIMDRRSRYPVTATYTVTP